MDEDVGLGRLRRPRPGHLTHILRQHDPTQPLIVHPALTDHLAICLVYSKKFVINSALLKPQASSRQPNPYRCSMVASSE